MSQLRLSANPWVETIVKVIVYSVTLAVIAHLIYLDGLQENVAEKYSENTFTEWSQVGCLALMLLFFIATGIVNPAGQRLSILMSGASLIALIREFNNFFNDQVFDGAWQTFAVLAAVVVGALFYRNRSDFSAAFTQFVQSSACGVMMAGFVTTFVFSRLFGRTVFWQAVMEGQYFRSVKNAAEEGVELLGYGLMLLGALEYFYFTVKQTKKK